MPFSLYLQQSAISNAQLKQYASTAQLFDMVKWTKEAYDHFGVPYFDTCCQAEPFNLDPFIPFLISAQVGNNITVSTFDNKLWAPQVSGMVYATGTTNYIAKFQGATSLIDSRISDTGSVLSISALTNATSSRVLYYNPSTSAVTQGDLTPFISGTPYYLSLFDATGAAITNSQVWTGSNKATLIIDGTLDGTQPVLIRQWDTYIGSDPYLYRGFDIINLLPAVSAANTGTGIHLRGYYSNTYAGMYSKTLSSGNSDLGIYVTNSGTRQEAIYIDSTTYVGIGTTSPTEKLDVSGNVKLSGVLNLTPQSSNPLSGTVGDIFLYHSGATWQLRVCTSTSPLTWTAL